MKLLKGAELAAYIKERQAHQVRALRQAHGIAPKLAIILANHNPVSESYIKMKKRYGADILTDVDLYQIEQGELKALIDKLNHDDSVHGIIVQLPLADPSQTDEVVNMVAAGKDVDGLGAEAAFDPATPLAIMWLLSGYNIDLAGKQVLLVGHGRLVGAPLEKLLLASGVTPAVADKYTKDLKAETLKADVIITATGKHGVIKPDMVKEGTVVVDAGTASEGNKIIGDLAPEMYERDDLTLTPRKGGVGPLTVCALFDNVIRAAQRVADKQHQPVLDS
ncbi:MAG TPA: bifunctional 5,10-methylenetetrahydrofolate dehydrogenase/5,10-methenyltetrahydrofolate cyclohydrolase [Candidatus Saccharimonadales bacterium]|nr:bifunctional 5,10-methylenetetrahydrofolate dehydrogenase/5,10-methenyltetrahydrofolate cyclohydrolase [Candidatus Saccharimonadales bacterium]